MPGAAGFPVLNMLLYLVIVISPVAACWMVMRLPRLIRRLRRRPQVVSTHPPIEKVAADLRRLHNLLAQFGPGTPIVRRRGTLQAYDCLLMQACTAVEVDHRLDRLPPGTSLELERIRVEESLRAAGLVIR
ncbi:hypothetical protein JOF56_004696 [Kibdelosporangium banguiense]|uniref:Uncharacterized protein n=1 Tax=Kibdelosporangium banguiense TaxID=1365924 RepID=A0ABS4TKD5_9PSEU|nr:hypothetical protein [Kibdelosporangium banguiense]MBP2324311.1 hypothetical protein [Kibdelosporangium banguiense]